MTATAQLDGKSVDLIKQARDIVAKAEAENRDVNTDEMAQLDTLVKQAQEHKDNVARAAKSKSALATIEGLADPAAAAAINDAAMAGAKTGMPTVGRKRTSDLFLESDQLKGLMQLHGVKNDGGRLIIPESAKGIQSGAIGIGGLKALVTGADHDTSAGAFVEGHKLGLIPNGLAELVLRDVITVGTTGSDTVEWVQQLRTGISGGSVNAAKGVPEATAVDDAKAVKPESTIKWAKRKSAVETIAHWMPMTKRALSDAGQVRTMIDQFLARGIDERVEDYILNGDVDNEGEWDGLLNTNGTQAQAFDTDVFTTVRRAITKVRQFGAPTGVLVSPATDEAIDLARDKNDRFYGAGPFSLGPSAIWSLPRIVVRDMPDDKFVLGDLRTAVLWDREQTTITVSDSHADFFVKNLLAILAEARAAFGVLDPALLVVGSLDDSATQG